MAKPIPDGFHTLSPHIIIRDVAKAIAFYKAAFGAEQVAVHYMPDGSRGQNGTASASSNSRYCPVQGEAARRWRRDGQEP